MTQEPETLYKLMTLYMLDKVNFPLTNSQLCQFFLDKNYTTYFTLQTVLSDLVESGMISSRQVGNATHYEINDDGRDALGFFISDVSKAAIADMDEYLNENKFRLRSETSVTADYYRTDNNNYNVRCMVREGKEILISIEVSVPDEGIAQDMCLNWKDKNQTIYSNIMMSLMNGSK